MENEPTFKNTPWGKRQAARYKASLNPKGKKPMAAPKPLKKKVAKKASKKVSKNPFRRRSGY